MMFVPLLGRVLLSLIFLISGVQKFLQPEANLQYMASQGMPFTVFFLYAAAMVEVVCGLSLLLGVKASWGALVLFLYLIPTTLIFHTNFADQNQQFHFFKNLAMMGGLLMVVYFGAGPMSLDSRLPALQQPLGR